MLTFLLKIKLSILLEYAEKLKKPVKRASSCSKRESSEQTFSRLSSVRASTSVVLAGNAVVEVNVLLHMGFSGGNKFSNVRSLISL